MCSLYSDIHPGSHVPRSFLSATLRPLSVFLWRRTHAFNALQKLRLCVSNLFLGLLCKSLMCVVYISQDWLSDGSHPVITPGLHSPMSCSPTREITFISRSITGMPKEKYDPPDPRRMYTIMSSEEAANGKKSYWAELEISGKFETHLCFFTLLLACFYVNMYLIARSMQTLDHYTYMWPFFKLLPQNWKHKKKLYAIVCCFSSLEPRDPNLCWHCSTPYTKRTLKRHGVSCTGPWPQLHWTPLGWTGMQTDITAWPHYCYYGWMNTHLYSHTREWSGKSL